MADKNLKKIIVITMRSKSKKVLGYITIACRVELHHCRLSSKIQPPVRLAYLLHMGSLIRGEN
jgi:hypothetical protein